MFQQEIDQQQRGGRMGRSGRFAAGAAVVLRKAMESGVGTTIDSELFSVDVSSWAAQGLFPSP